MSRQAMGCGSVCMSPWSSTRWFRVVCLLLFFLWILSSFLWICFSNCNQFFFWKERESEFIFLQSGVNLRYIGRICTRIRNGLLRGVQVTYSCFLVSFTFFSFLFSFIARFVNLAASNDHVVCGSCRSCHQKQSVWQTEKDNGRSQTASWSSLSKGIIFLQMKKNKERS